MVTYQLHASCRAELLDCEIAGLDGPGIRAVGMSRHVLLYLGAAVAPPHQQTHPHAALSRCNQQVAIGLGTRPGITVTQQLHARIEAPAHQVDAFLGFRNVLGDGGEAFLSADVHAELVVVRDGMGDFPLLVLVFGKPLNRAFCFATDFVDVNQFGSQVFFSAHDGPCCSDCKVRSTCGLPSRRQAHARPRSKAPPPGAGPCF